MLEGIPQENSCSELHTLRNTNWGGIEAAVRRRLRKSSIPKQDWNDIVQDCLVDYLSGRRVIGAADKRNIVKYYTALYIDPIRGKTCETFGSWGLYDSKAPIRAHDRISVLCDRDRRRLVRMPLSWEIVAAVESGRCPKCSGKVEIDYYPYDEEGIGGGCCYCPCGFAFSNFSP